MGGRGVIKSGKWADVVYGWPLSRFWWNKKFLALQKLSYIAESRKLGRIWQWKKWYDGITCWMNSKLQEDSQGGKKRVGTIGSKPYWIRFYTMLFLCSYDLTRYFPTFRYNLKSTENTSIQFWTLHPFQFIVLLAYQDVSTEVRRRALSTVNLPVK